MGNHLTRSARSRWATWMLAFVLSRHTLEAVMGDLDEEHALRSRSISAADAARWYWGQIGRSIPHLLWSAILRGGRLATLGAAAGACLVQAALEFAGHSAISTAFAPQRVPPIVFLFLGLTTLVLVGYLAAWIRPGAATVLAGMVVIAAAAMVMAKDDSAPAWYRIASLALGPLASLAGGALFLKKQTEE
jgi:hypothetical protein